MRLIILKVVTLLIIGSLAKDEDESNELSVSPRPKNLDEDLRRALLKALTELENEETEEFKSEEDGNRILEKASASAVSFYTNSQSASKSAPTTTTTDTPSTTTKKPIIVVQRSQGIQHAPITTVEKTEIDPFNDAEQILTSASSSFTIPSHATPTKSDIEVRSSNRGNTNLIKNDEKVSTKVTKVVTTTAAPTTSTEENEAKVEDVQFFSAPLVAAFTVHQDEQGVPKKVEPIYKPLLTKKQEDKLMEGEVNQQQNKKQQKIVAQLDLHQKQKALEEEIARLNLSLRQQQQLNQQQQEFFFRQQQEQLRLRNNAQPFRPMVNPNFGEFTTQRPVLNQFTSRGANFETTKKSGVNNFVTVPTVSGQQLPVKPAQVFNNPSDKSRQSVSLLPSITYDPLIEAGKLPFNAQVLPVKGPINFHAPIIQTNGFQQFHSLSHIHPTNTPFVGNFNQLVNAEQQYRVGENQRNRFFRQETGVGNFVKNDPKSYPSFSIQKSVQPTQQNTFSDNRLSANFNAFALPSTQQSNRFFRSNVPNQQFQEPQANRFFRSNLESTLRSPNNYQQSHFNNYQLHNLLYSSGALREKSPVDINIISKVLSLDHSGDGQLVGLRRRRD